MYGVLRMRSAKFQSLIRPRFSSSRMTQSALLFFSQASFADSGMGGNSTLKVVESFPNPPDDSEKPVAPLPASLSSSLLDSKKLKAISRVSEISPAGKLRPQFLYLIELGIDLDLIIDIARRHPPFAYLSLEGKIKPMVEFLLDLGVSKSDILTILKRRPQLCGMSLSENIIPSMAFLEGLGVDKKQWAKVICSSPGVLCYSRQKVKSTVDFLYEMGLTAESIGKILTRYPQITSLSVEATLKPATEFFLGRGFSMEEVGTMISRFGPLYTLSLTKNLISKWDFFLTMDYPQSDLVKFPAYFGCSLERRIKPRYALMKECGVVLPLSRLLSLSSDDFDKALKMKMMKKTY